ncbi:MAG: nicotinate-nucleotide diphosphorylase (carboxylating), partial [Thermoguttaceae bacterium]|nr:nicotinate-nucleotide diphosphorylase (carboxylating) [Thermoguttaceae bacterium]
MQRDFNQQVWNETLQKDAERIIQWAINEDTDVDGDLTSQALIPPEMMGKAAVVARESGVVCGLVFVEMILQKVDSKLHWQGILKDGEFVFPGEKLGIVTGPVLSMLTAERLLLNMVGRLSGIASLTRDYLQEIGESHVRLYDTRKTTLGWRRLEKYAVHCGGGYNHRSGLYDAILIKDNHLAFVGEYHVSPADAVRKARDWLAKRFFPPFPI